MFRRKPEPVSVIPAHVKARVGRLATGDLMGWADQAIYTTGRTLTMYQRTGDETSLREAAEAAQVLVALIEEMSLRSAR